MKQPVSRVRMSDIEAVGSPKLVVAAIVGVPVGAILALVFTVIFVTLVPAGDLVFIANPIIGAIGGFIIAPLTLVRREMARRDSAQ